MSWCNWRQWLGWTSWQYSSFTSLASSGHYTTSCLTLVPSSTICWSISRCFSMAPKYWISCHAIFDWLLYLLFRNWAQSEISYRAWSRLSNFYEFKFHIYFSCSCGELLALKPWLLTVLRAQCADWSPGTSCLTLFWSG